MENFSANKRYNRMQLSHSSRYRRRYFYPYDGRFRKDDDYVYKKHTFSQEKAAKKKYKKKKSRPASPIEGSEEYMSQKIQKTSAIIMRHLLSPEENIIPVRNDVNIVREARVNPRSADNNERRRTKSFGVVESTLSKACNIQIIDDIYNKRTESIETNDNSTGKSVTYNVEEIHSKIMNHLSNLNDRRKRTLISTSTSVYDEAIHQILKQKRLEISRALRNVQMQTPDVTQSTEWINSIIPDMGIKIEDLPQEVLVALQNTFNASEEEDNGTNSGFSDLEIRPPHTNDVSIKTEQHEEDEPVEVMEDLSNEVIQIESETENDETLSEVGPNDVVEVSSGELMQSQSESMLPEVSHETSIQSVVNNGVLNHNEILPRNTYSTSTQTPILTIEDFIQGNFKKPPKTFAAAARRMVLIDKYIAKLTEYRQNMFTKLLSPKKVKIKHCVRSVRRINTGGVTKISTKRLQQELQDENLTQGPDTPRSQHNSDEKRLTKENDASSSHEKPVEPKLLNFGNISEKMLIIKVYEDMLVAGTESGKIFFFSVQDSSCVKVIDVTTVPITCLHYAKDEDGKPYLFIGSFGSSLKVYNFYSTSLLCDTHIDDDSIQCIDEKWGYLFLGCLRSTILRYSLKKNALEYEERFDGNPIFALWATQEGARMVLLIGSRNSAVIIRDAMSGLHLRTMENIITPTVYSMIMEKNLVFCGTTTHNILVFDFHNGKLLHTYDATNSKGIRCMKIVGRCLFASCYNGKVYVYNLENNSHIGTLDGPGGVIISMEVLTNQVILGTMSCKFSSTAIPQYILKQI